MSEVVPIDDDGIQELPLYLQQPQTPSPPHAALQIITIKDTEHDELGWSNNNNNNISNVWSRSQSQSHSQRQRQYMKELESWLPITQSRNGTVFSATFHLLCSGIGFQALLLPVAFVALGWAWGIICMSIAYIWQLYTIWLLVNLHEPVAGTRHSRYVRLAIFAFGPRLGKLIAIFPVTYMSSGSCVLIIINGGGTMQQFYKLICSPGTACASRSLSGTEWFLIFTAIATIINQLPSLNSRARVSLIGAIAAIGYCTTIWALSLSKGRLHDVSYSSLPASQTGIPRFTNILASIGFIMLSFRGHNLILEIQGTLPSSSQQPPRTSMWRAVIVSYIIIALCLFPLGIVGFWAYGNKIPRNGLLIAFTQFHKQDTPKALIGLIYILLIISCLSSYQVYAMPSLDNIEFVYSSKKKRACRGWVRVGSRLFFGGLTFFMSVAFPFMGSLAPLLGGLAVVPLAYAYPCLMWISIKKPGRPVGAMWSLTLGLGLSAIVLSVLLVISALWNLIDLGLHANFFRP